MEFYRGCGVDCCASSSEIGSRARVRRIGPELRSNGPERGHDFIDQLSGLVYTVGLYFAFWLGSSGVLAVFKRLSSWDVLGHNE